MISSRDGFHIFSSRILTKRPGFGAVIMASYLLAITWQYFSGSMVKPVGWVLAAITAVIVWLVYRAIDQSADEQSPREFWLVAGLPLLFFYVIRLPFPDISFDVLNYHILHSERALRGPLLITGDFFPTPAPFNPTSDILTGLYRQALGYRLGTIVNLAALLWTASIIERFSRDWIRSRWLRSAAVLIVVATEQVLFQINNYMVDLLALPLLLEATAIALTINAEKIGRRTIQLSLLLGVAVALKLANLIYAVPISVIFLGNVIAAGSPRSKSFRELTRSAPLAILVFILPLLPFTIFIYRLTGNPVFPLYNGLFKSPYWPQGVAFDPRWGPHGVLETIAWPVIMFFRAERLCEFPFYSGRLSLGFIVAIVLIFVGRRQRQAWQLALITVAGTMLWSGSSGYIRYALYLELTSGILIVWTIVMMWERAKASRPLWVIACLSLLLLLPTPFALARAYGWEWSARNTIFQHRLQLDASESSNLLRDRSLSAYIAPEDRKLFDDVELWIDTTYKTSAIAALLRPQLPIIGVRVHEYFVSPVGRKKIADELSSQRDKRMYTLCDPGDIDQARNDLSARGLAMGDSHPVSIYFFSRTLKFDLLLAQVLPRARAADAGAGAQKGSPLPDDAFNARLSVANPPPAMRAGQKYDLRVLLKNESEITWPGQQPTWQFQITVGDRWMTQKGVKVNDLDGRAAVQQDLPPRGTREISLTVTAPREPGIYILQVDAIQEGVAWFGERGSEVLNLTVTVQK